MKGPASASYLFEPSPDHRTFLSRLLLREFKDVTNACLKAGVRRDHLRLMLTELIAGGRRR